MINLKSKIYLLLILGAVHHIFSQDLNTKTEVFQAIPCIYEEARDFSDGLAHVRLNGKWSFIDNKGTEIIKCEGDEIHEYSDFKNGLSIVAFEHYGDNKFYFINKQGKKISNIYNHVSDFNEGLACVEYDGWRGLIDKNANKVLKCNCDKADFFNGLLEVSIEVSAKESKTAFIEKNGNMKFVSPFSSSDGCSYFLNSSIIVNRKKNNIYDLNGSKLIPFDDIINVFGYYNGWVRIEKKDGKRGFFNIETKKLSDFSYENAELEKYISSEGFSAVKINGKYGFVDNFGKLVIPAIYEKVDYFCEGLAPVLLKNKWGFIDKTGKLVIPAKFEAYSTSVEVHDENSKYFNNDSDFNEITKSFNNGLIRVMLNQKWGIIDKFGNIISDFKYDIITKFSEGFAEVGIGEFMEANGTNKVGLIDKYGNEIVPCIYEEVGIFKEGMLRVKMNGKYGYLAIKR